MSQLAHVSVAPPAASSVSELQWLPSRHWRHQLVPSRACAASVHPPAPTAPSAAARPALLQRTSTQCMKAGSPLALYFPSCAKRAMEKARTQTGSLNTLCCSCRRGMAWRGGGEQWAVNWSSAGRDSSSSSHEHRHGNVWKLNLSGNHCSVHGRRSSAWQGSSCGRQAGSREPAGRHYHVGVERPAAAAERALPHTAH